MGNGSPRFTSTGGSGRAVGGIHAGVRRACTRGITVARRSGRCAHDPGHRRRGHRRGHRSADGQRCPQQRLRPLETAKPGGRGCRTTAENGRRPRGCAFRRAEPAGCGARAGCRRACRPPCPHRCAPACCCPHPACAPPSVAPRHCRAAPRSHALPVSLRAIGSPQRGGGGLSPQPEWRRRRVPPHAPGQCAPVSRNERSDHRVG